MRKKEIEKIPWKAKAQGKKIVIESEIVKLSDDIECILVDITQEVPQIRIALTLYDYGNYIPAGSVFSENRTTGFWNTKNLDNMNIYGYGKLNKTKPEVISEESLQKIISFCVRGMVTPWNCAIEALQREIRSDKAELERERNAHRIEKRMKTVSEYPKGFVDWGYKFLSQHEMALLPFRKKKETIGKCSNCGSDIVYKRGTVKPKDIVKCPSCGCDAKVRRVDWMLTNPVPVNRVHIEVVLFQKTEEGFVERHVLFQKEIGIGKEEAWHDEIGRVFRIKRRTKTYFHKHSYYSGIDFWDDTNLYGMSNIVLHSGPVYPKTIRKEMFRDTPYKYCAMELIKNEPNLNPIEYLEKYEKIPEIEMMVKVGLKKLALEISSYNMHQGMKPWERLGITKKQFNRMRNINGGIKELYWMEFEQQTGVEIGNSVIHWFVEQEIQSSHIGFIRDRMTEMKIMNYLKKQSRMSGRSPKELLGTWEDYLAMAERLKMNVQQEIFYKPKDLIVSHNEAVKLSGGQELAKRAAEIVKKFPDVDDICKSIVEKYSFQDDNYAIVVPEKIEDIIKEGRTLGHCLDRSDIYFDRIQKRESFIVFLRKTEEIDKPYYTLEIEPGGAARQKRTTGDKQNKDFDSAKRFIRKWQHEIQKRLSAEDKRLAAISDAMRIQELQELREQNTRIWHGHLAGQMLADVLESDFMAVEEEIRRCG